MAKDDNVNHIASPQVYLVRMVVFLVLIGFIAAAIYPQIKDAFLANAALNGLIVGVLVLGIAYAFRQVLRLFREVRWVNDFRVADPGLEAQNSPRLLAPMATLLGDRRGRVELNPLTMRSLLDSLATRLDESRDISRYMIGLLIFLGLLGTFWGLLDTVHSVGRTIAALNVSETSTASVFEELKSGLAAPLSGMGTAFSSSLFGLAGSLVLGFLDLQASQSQNRFYNELEEWLSTVTNIRAGEMGEQTTMPAHIHLTLRSLQHMLEQLDGTLQQSAQAPDCSIERLAEGVEELIRQMRSEQREVREWAQGQADTQDEIRRQLEDLAAAGRGRPRS